MGKWAKYSRVYNRKWESDIILKDWIEPVTGSPGKAYCKYCKKCLRVHFTDLHGHAASKKHQLNAQAFNEAGGVDVKPVVSPPTEMKSSLSCHAFRLGPGQNITDELVNYVQLNGLKAAFIMTCVGSITKGTIRLAHATSENRNKIIKLNDKFEITSLVGTICNSGTFHLHATLGDAKGNSISGHVVGGMEVFTTAEIVIGECCDLQFDRIFDGRTGFDELCVQKRKHNIDDIE